ncbi:MAG TPA: 16S rRNA (guanine(966)-N(2))-methyltransferase RsmD [Steroidobacteraceae bacterium]|nr:16S rRNA (guanine(966)-N(2))-methyltransferase RsmD [Steroidobacteraceae bacterium]
MAAGARNAIRIIGGTWRGRRIRFPPAAELRPTPDRVRETLFNWLQGEIAGARCLDLFAGSGALGLEAISRGAREVVFVEHDRAVAAALRASLATLKDSRGMVLERDAFAFLAGPAERFDVVFLDPPFARGWMTELCKLLESRGWLAARAVVYLETAAREPTPALPAEWTLSRETRAGEVRGLLARRTAPGSRTDVVERVDET